MSFILILAYSMPFSVYAEDSSVPELESGIIGELEVLGASEPESSIIGESQVQEVKLLNMWTDTIVIKNCDEVQDAITNAKNGGNH